MIGPYPRNGCAPKPTDEELAFVWTDGDRAELAGRPRMRGECVAGERPCPWFSCRHHLGLDVSPDTGSVKLTHEDLEAMPETCSLDLADRGGMTLEEVGAAMNVTRERVRQIETKASKSMNAALRAHRIRPDVLAGIGDEHTNSPL